MTLNDKNVVTFGEEHYGRDVAVKIDPPDADPGVGQFCVTLLVDGKPRWFGFFTDKREDGLADV